jgi:alpha-L-arabinofuranosidase
MRLSKEPKPPYETRRRTTETIHRIGDTMNRVFALIRNYEEIFVVTVVQSAFTALVVWTSVSLLNALVSIDKVAALAMSSGAF